MTQQIATSPTPANLVNTIFTIFVMLKLISIGHPSSKPYYDEICQNLYPNSELSDCEERLYTSLQKFDHLRSTNSLANGTFEDSYEALMFLMQHMVRGTTTGNKLRETVCLNFWKPDDYNECQELIKTTMEKLKHFFQQLDNTKVRQKRSCFNRNSGNNRNLPRNLADRAQEAARTAARNTIANNPRAAGAIGAAGVGIIGAAVGIGSPTTNGRCPLGTNTNPYNELYDRNEIVHNGESFNDVLNHLTRALFSAPDVDDRPRSWYSYTPHRVNGENVAGQF
jgi:hypothetical protein